MLLDYLKNNVKLFLLIDEKLAAFSLWNENDTTQKRVIYGMITCNNLYGDIIFAMVERKPGENICMKLNTEGRNIKSR